MKALKIKLNEDITEEHTGPDLISLAINDDGEGYINLSQVSQFAFYSNEIYMVLGPRVESGRPICLQFNENSMGEYHRIKRELQEAFEISEVIDSELVSVA